MNDKKLISEISRIQNLMGLKNHLILEQLNKIPGAKKGCRIV